MNLNLKNISHLIQCIQNLKIILSIKTQKFYFKKEIK